MTSQSKETRNPNWSRDELILTLELYLKETKFPAGTLRTACHTIGGVVCVGIVMLVSFSAQAQNLFVADFGSGNIYEFTPGGAQSTFASGLSSPAGLAFDSAGNLFEAERGPDAFNGSINEFTPDGAQSIFASGLSGPYGLAFQPVPEPSVFGLLTVGSTALLVRRRKQ
jgi:hypothetical protein